MNLYDYGLRTTIMIFLPNNATHFINFVGCLDDKALRKYLSYFWLGGYNLSEANTYVRKSFTYSLIYYKHGHIVTHDTNEHRDLTYKDRHNIEEALLILGATFGR